MKRRLLVSLVIAAASGSLCSLMLMRLDIGAGDFNYALHEGRDLLAGKDPYIYYHGEPSYPLYAAIIGIPFVWTGAPPAIAAGLFFGLSTGLLALGLTRHSYTRLLVLLAYPYWAAMLTAQWSPLLMAAAFYSWLLPVTLAKPQIGMPIALTNLSKRGVLACITMVVLSVILMPGWLWRWLPTASRHEHFVPLLVLPGPALLLALWKLRDSDSHLLLLAAAAPQRWFYDAFILWLIPKDREEIVTTVCLSWVAGIWRWYHMPHSYAQVALWQILWMYLPMLTVILLRGREVMQKTYLAAGASDVRQAVQT